METKYVAATVVLLVVVLASGFFLVMLRPQEEDVVLQLIVNGEEREGYTLGGLDGTASITDVPGQESPLHAVRLTTLLTEADIDPSDVTIVKSIGVDGYWRDVEGEYVDEAYIWVVEEDQQLDWGTLKIIYPSLEAKFSVHHLARIEVETSGAFG